MITPQSANWTTLVTAREGRHVRQNLYIEGIPDVICTEAPPDAKAKTYALTFDGVNDYANCGNNAALTQIADWTLLAWVKTDVLESRHLVYCFDSMANRGYAVRLTAAGKFEVLLSGMAGTWISATTTTITAGAWTYLAISVGGNGQTVIQSIVGDADQAAVYQALTRASRNAFTAGQSFYIGDTSASGITPWDGNVGYMAIFNRALTPKEMRRAKYRILDKSWGNDDGTGLWDACVTQWDFERRLGSTIANTKSPGIHDCGLAEGASWIADPPFTITYRPVLSAEAAEGQDVEPLSTKTSISGATLRVLDTDQWFTTKLKDLSLGVLRKDVRVHLGFAGLLESEYQPVFAGTVNGFDFAAKGYSLRLGDVFSASKVRVNLAKSTLGANWTTGGVSTEVAAHVESYWLNAEDLALNGYMRVDQDIIRYTTDQENTASLWRLLGAADGQFGTTGADHATGDVCRELWVLDGFHPLTIALRLLLSGAGFEATSSHDLYTEVTYTGAAAGTRTLRKRGLGLSPSDVAIAEIESLRDNKFSGLQFKLFIEDSITDLKDFIEREILRPLGCYFFTKSDGRLSIGSHKIPTTSDVVYAIDPTQIAGVPDWEITQDHVVNYLQVEYDWDPGDEEYDGQYFATNAESVADYGLKKREATFKGVDGDYSPTALLDAWKGDMFARFKDPYVTCRVTCGLFEFLLEIGDAVLFTHMNLPNVSTGVLGLHEQLWQVVGRRPDYRRGRVELTLADVSRA